MSPDAALPLSGVRVIEFSHMVMGPACGMVLADLGAEVIKVEPEGSGDRRGDPTRSLKGSGAGFFPLFNRNKKSVTLDLHSESGRAQALRLIADADVVCENFKPGTMAKFGLDYARLKPTHPRLIYVSLKGFLAGPYERRTALDEVVQMMGGLAYMTGRPGDPLRAGTSINDIMGGVFGALGVLAALIERQRTGRGQEVQSGLFENNALLVAQHMLQHQVTGLPVSPMPARVSAWGIYDVFTTADRRQMFLAVVTDTGWQAFCRAFGFDDWATHPDLTTNNQRVAARSWLLPLLRERMAQRESADIAAVFEANDLPYAPIATPHDLLSDPHLIETGTLATETLPDGREVQTVLLPLSLGGRRLPLRLSPPRIGQHNDEYLDPSRERGG